MKKIKVAINNSPLTTDHNFRGIGVYTRNLVDSLKKRTDLEVLEFSGSTNIVDVDLIHYPFFDLFRYSLPFVKKFPTVVTIHDVIPLIFPQYYPAGIKGLFFNMIQKLSLGGVKGIITDSNSSKTDVVRYLGVNPKKIFPVYLAPAEHFHKIKDSVFLKEVKGKYELPEKFAVYFGDVNWNKNLINLAVACQNAKIDIVFVGKGFEKKDVKNHRELRSYRKFLQTFGNDPHVHILGFVPDKDLTCIVNLAAVTLLPSFYEGFGLSILESQICGTPVITSNISSMPEVAGKGAILIDPYNVESITVALKKVVSSQQVKQALIREGLENVRKFSWEKAAQETARVYRLSLC